MFAGVIAELREMLTEIRDLLREIRDQNAAAGH